VVLPKPNGIDDVRRALEIINRVAVPNGRAARRCRCTC
jgi:hypothetical protein